MSTFLSAFWPSNTKRDHFAFEATCSMIWALNDGDMSGMSPKEGHRKNLISVSAHRP
jgi:hypothetical protein